MKKGIIIDANLLLLLVIGAVEEGRHIKTSGRLGKFNVHDYHTVLKTMGGVGLKVFITPYLATEVSNLIDLNGYAADMAYEAAKILFQIFDQIDVTLSEDCESDIFTRYGLTDASLVRLVKDYVIFTDDGRLLTPLYEVNYDNVITFETVREGDR